MNGSAGTSPFPFLSPRGWSLRPNRATRPRAHEVLGHPDRCRWKLLPRPATLGFLDVTLLSSSSGERKKSRTWYENVLERATVWCLIIYDSTQKTERYRNTSMLVKLDGPACFICEGLEIYSDTKRPTGLSVLHFSVEIVSGGHVCSTKFRLHVQWLI